jgi:hypothetical protein
MGSFTIDEVQLHERLFAKVRTVGSCWQWTASQDGRGYGQIRVGSRVLAAHRVAYELLVGPIPDGLTIDHLCRNRLCLRPSHLEPVSMAENQRREAAAITHCKSGHEFTPENTAPDGNGRRRCRTCKNRWMRNKTQSKSPSPKEV